jgi:hypothetical protein
MIRPPLFIFTSGTEVKGTLIWPLHRLCQTVRPFTPEIGSIVFLLWQKIYLAWVKRGEGLYNREYWRIYTGPGFIAVLWFGSSLTPSAPLPSAIVYLSQSFVPRLSSFRFFWGGGATSQIIWPWESLALYKSFNTLCCTPSFPPMVVHGR